MEEIPTNVIFLKDTKVLKFSKYFTEELAYYKIISDRFLNCDISTMIYDFDVGSAMYKKDTKIYFDERVVTCSASYSASLSAIFIVIYNCVPRFNKFINYEIKTPVLAGVELSNLLSSTKISKEQTKYVTAIKENNFELSRVINNASDYLKLLSGAVDVKKEKFNLDIAFDTIKKVIIKDKNININFIIEKDIFLHTDKRKFIQIVINVITHSMKNLMKGMINVKASTKKGVLNIYFTDTGNKMSKKTIDSLFKGFVEDGYIHSHSSLYLPIAKGISKIIKGDLSLISSSENGNSYRFSIPILDENSD